MSLGEFDLIKQYFNKKNSDVEKALVAIGIGDDCAILDIPNGYQLAVTTDSLVSGVHFFEDVDPYRLGYKSLAVNLSDLAAMGAEPKWVSLAITLPDVNEQWLSEFSRGFFDLAKQHQVTLVGGDTTKGPLSITVSAKGLVKRGCALLRNGAKPGDLICVSGTLGDGAVGLAQQLESLSLINAVHFTDALEITEPRNQLGCLLVDHASACIDISDGLIQDLQHILSASQCSAKINTEKLPLSTQLRHEIDSHCISLAQAQRYALTGGDDYELLFSIDPQQYSSLCTLTNSGQNMITDITVIGEVMSGKCASVHLFENNQRIDATLGGWDHFK